MWTRLHILVSLCALWLSFSALSSVEAHPGGYQGQHFIVSFPQGNFSTHALLKAHLLSTPPEPGYRFEFISQVGNEYTFRVFCHCGSEQIFYANYGLGYFGGSSLVHYGVHSCVPLPCAYCGGDSAVGSHGDGVCNTGLCELCGRDLSVGEHGEDVCAGEHICNWCRGDLREGEHGHGVCDVEPPVPCEWCGGNSSEGQHGDGVCNVVPPVVCPWCGGDPSVGAHGFRHGECSHECEVCEWCGGDVSVGQHGDGVCNLLPLPKCAWCGGDPTVGQHGDGVCNKEEEDDYEKYGPLKIADPPEVDDVMANFREHVESKVGEVTSKIKEKFASAFSEIELFNVPMKDITFQWRNHGKALTQGKPGHLDFDAVIDFSFLQFVSDHEEFVSLLRLVLLSCLGLWGFFESLSLVMELFA